MPILPTRPTVLAVTAYLRQQLPQLKEMFEYQGCVKLDLVGLRLMANVWLYDDQAVLLVKAAVGPERQWERRFEYADPAFPGNLVAQLQVIRGG